MPLLRKKRAIWSETWPTYGMTTLPLLADPHDTGSEERVLGRDPIATFPGSCPRTHSSDPVSSGSASKGSFVIPYVGQVSDQIARLFCSSSVMTHIRPYNMIRASLVRPKDWKNRQVWCTPSMCWLPCILHRGDQETPGETAQGTSTSRVPSVWTHDRGEA